MKVTASLFVVLVAATSVIADSGRNAEKRQACVRLAAEVEKRMKETEARADEQVSIGNRLDGSGKVQPSKVIRYGDSHKRLDDVLHNICSDADCKEIVQKYEDDITTWFDEKRSTPFSQHICDTKFPPHEAEVSIEDDSGKTQPKAASKPAAKKEEPVKKVQAPNKGTEKASSESQFDPMSIIHTIVARFKGNMQRIWRLTVEMKGELQPMVMGKKWPQLKELVFGRMFWQKYWIVFAAWTFAVYFICGLIEPFLGRSKKPSTRGTRSSSSAGGSKKKASTGKVGKKDE